MCVFEWAFIYGRKTFNNFPNDVCELFARKNFSFFSSFYFSFIRRQMKWNGTFFPLVILDSSTRKRLRNIWFNKRRWKIKDFANSEPHNFGIEKFFKSVFDSIRTTHRTPSVKHFDLIYSSFLGTYLSTYMHTVLTCLTTLLLDGANVHDWRNKQNLP